MTCRKEFKELVQANLLCKEKGDDSWSLTLSIKNDNDFPVKLIGLLNRQNVLLIDSQGFAHTPDAASPRTLTVPSRAAVKTVFNFSDLEEALPDVIRLYGEPVPLSQPGIPVEL